MISYTIDIDNRLLPLFKNQHGSSNYHQSNNHRNNNNSNNYPQQQVRINKDNKQHSTPSTFGPTPMDTAHDQPITDVVRSSRISNNLCLYCGGNNHRVKDCRSKPKGKQAASSLVSTILAE